MNFEAEIKIVIKRNDEINGTSWSWDVFYETWHGDDYKFEDFEGALSAAKEFLVNKIQN